MSLLPARDEVLVEAARTVIRRRFRAGWQAVGCALRTRSGTVHLGVHLECHVGRVAVCAEAVAIGRAVTDGDGDMIETIVAVYQSSAEDDRPVVVSPCGMCREMISDYAPNCRVVVPGPAGPEVVAVASLLPRKFERAGAPAAPA